MRQRATAERSMPGCPRRPGRRAIRAPPTPAWASTSRAGAASVVARRCPARPPSRPATRSKQSPDPRQLRAISSGGQLRTLRGPANAGVMSRWESQSPDVQLPRPGRALQVILITLLGLWLMFAMALNWANADPAIFQFFAGSTEAILRGQVWRLFTASLIHLPSDP